MLQFYSASTSIVNSKRAITECLEVALEGEPNLDCNLIIFYTSIGHNFKELLSEARKQSPNARIMGCTGAGVIGREGANESMRALAIMAVKGTHQEFAIVGCESMVGKDPYEIAARMALDLKNQNPAVNMIHFLPSSLDVYPVDRAIMGIESVFGADTPIFGGNSIDNMKGINTFQFLDNQIFERGAIMLGMADPSLSVISRASHGYNIMDGMPFEVTRVESNCIYELNGQPAWKVYTEALGMPESSNFMEMMPLAVFAVLISEEFHEEYGNKYTIFGCMGKKEDNSIIFTTVFEKGSIIYLAKRDEEGMFGGVDQMLNNLLKLLQDKEIVAVFHADCVIRGKLSFNRILKDEIINRIQYPIFKDKQIPWLGLYSGGEFARIANRNWFHQFTSTLSVLYR